MSALLITLGKIAGDGQSELEQYAAGTIPLIEAAGGTVICRLRPTETLVGQDCGRPDLVAVIRFESPEAVHALLESAAYRRQVAHRNRAFAEIHSYIAMDI